MLTIYHQAAHTLHKDWSQMLLTPTADKTYKTKSGCMLAVRNRGLDVIRHEVIKSPDDDRFHPVFYVHTDELQTAIIVQGFHARLLQP